ncbi:cryptochrome-1 [Sabethes cyaneus]|uniref:cryptochrome-1 n=1 Tax=Sabethes cyaneus TaxID=53552 RepID=UPI00237D5B46|nr:cryptochrome-1 [Sabethes cyaneus]
MSRSTQQTVLHWFRKGLRVHDNPALSLAFRKASESLDGTFVLRPVFFLDPAILKWLKVGPNRWRFLQQSLVDLDNNLRRLNSRLYVVRGNPVELLPGLFKEWNVCLLTYEYDIEPYALKRDVAVQKHAEEARIKVTVEKSHTIFDADEIIRKNGGNPPLTYDKFNRLAFSCKLPDPQNEPDPLKTVNIPDKDQRESADEKCYHPPTLEELGVREDLGECKYPGGETEGLRRLQEYMNKIAWVCSFEKPKTSPNSLQPSTTVLSPYVKFGCLSSRLFMKELQQVVKGRKHSHPPVSLIGQLMWREFYYCAAAAEPNFDKMVGNNICLQVPWSTDKADQLEAWAFGKTGYPFIDAIMRQLRQEGWIHHLARHAVACFLTRGDLWISWEEGQKVFEDLLLDADWALNAGNWMWLSASAFFHQYYRVYSPVAFGKKTDPTGSYIRKYVPELARYPESIIYEPWKANLEQQRKLGCVIGKDYPQRIVIHEIESKKNMTKMSNAYRENKLAKEAKKGQGKTTPSTSKRRPDDDLPKQPDKRSRLKDA